jgi:hypothetical protein
VDTGCSHTTWPRSAPAPLDPTTARLRPRSGSRYRQNATPRPTQPTDNFTAKRLRRGGVAVAVHCPGWVPGLTQCGARRRVGAKNRGQNHHRSSHPKGVERCCRLSEQRSEDAQDAQDDDDPDDDDGDQKKDQEPKTTAVTLSHYDHLRRWWGCLAHNGASLSVC